VTAAGERIVLTKWSPLMALGVLLTTGVLAAGPVLALRDAETVPERVVLGVLTAVFALPLLWSMWRIPNTLRGMGIAFDHKGIHSFDGWRTQTFLWSDIARVGLGSYSRTYRGMKTKCTPAFEIYVNGADEPTFRHALSPYSEDAARLEDVVRRFHPELWGGPFLHEVAP
jgi:hypothetical protein